MDIYVQVPAFQEGPAMLPVLDAISSQEVPADWSVTYECWVTLDPPDKALCDTWHTAIDAAGFDAFEAPKGKLSARNAAHDHAVEDGADVIVQWDADAPPVNDTALWALCEPFTDPAVVATVGRPSANRGLLSPYLNVKIGVQREVVGAVWGALSAFTADAWERAGPFDTHRDQTSIWEVWKEEEYAFGQRLGGLGRVLPVDEATVQADTRRADCTIQRAFDRMNAGHPDDWCQNRGVTSFEPEAGRRGASWDREGNK